MKYFLKIYYIVRQIVLGLNAFQQRASVTLFDGLDYDRSELFVQVTAASRFLTT